MIFFKQNNYRKNIHRAPVANNSFRRYVMYLVTNNVIFLNPSADSAIATAQLMNMCISSLQL